MSSKRKRGGLNPKERVRTLQKDVVTSLNPYYTPCKHRDPTIPHRELTCALVSLKSKHEPTTILRTFDRALDAPLCDDLLTSFLLVMSPNTPAPLLRSLSRIVAAASPTPCLPDIGPVFKASTSKKRLNVSYRIDQRDAVHLKPVSPTHP